MNKRRRIAITTALASMLSMPLASGLPAARADGLAASPSNQALLQQRLDLLARGRVSSAGGGYNGDVPGAAKAAAGSFPRSFLIPGTDTSIRVGGSVNFSITHVFSGGNAH